ncbi:YdiU family protein [Phreatobacter aquaticus]|uniref:Protein nucleotidyltransferase YdiU n=1 Tax=Phreatobacter aquaticus TaxID=2570229 RepID=A0A4D7QIQ2_9HYPH|nr:YdiU family protein [Phreatobacter aquaticus]QCK86531.1 YdiU family protein [Phreatobacter aquaticus]
MSSPSPAYSPSTAHLDLGDGFFDPVEAAHFPAHTLRYRNQRWAERIGLGGLTDDQWIAHFGRFQPLPENIPQPVALRYHGHQFRSYNPEIGDGRGFLFAQARDGEGRLLDLATKGSGQTPYSRFGDGRLTLKGGVREVLATAMLEAFGVYTSKSFSLIETGEALQRQDEPSPTRSSVLVRLSHSHVRFGTFQRLLAENDQARIAQLVGHCVRHYHPQAARGGDVALEAPALLEAVAKAAGAMVAEWMLAGFVHGVLNTDNMVVTGESFDYGPWRFLPHYEPGFTAAYFDQTGLYAYGRQPGAVAWNFERFAECLTLVAPVADLETALKTYGPAFNERLRRMATGRLGVMAKDEAADEELLAAFFQFLHHSKAPFERTIFDWHGGAGRRDFAIAGPSAAHYQGEAFDRFFAALAAHEPIGVTPEAEVYFSGPAPATLTIDEVEKLWAPIAEADDWSLFTAKLAHIDQARLAFGLHPAR